MAALAQLQADDEVLLAALLVPVPPGRARGRRACAGDFRRGRRHAGARAGAGGRQRHPAGLEPRRAPATRTGRRPAQAAAGARLRRAPGADPAGAATGPHAGHQVGAGGGPATGCARDPGNLRPARQPSRHLAVQVGAGGPRVPLQPARGLQAHRRAGCKSKRAEREHYIDDVKRGLGRELEQAGRARRDHRPAQAHLQHLAEDAAQGPAVRAGDGRARGARHRRHRRRLLCGARRRARAVALHPRRVRRLHRDAQGQPLPLAAHRGGRPGQAAARGADPHARDARARRARRGRALAVQGRAQGRGQLPAEDRLAAPAARARARATAPSRTCSPACRPRSSRTASTR